MATKTKLRQAAAAISKPYKLILVHALPGQHTVCAGRSRTFLRGWTYGMAAVRPQLTIFHVAEADQPREEVQQRGPDVTGDQPWGDPGTGLPEMHEGLGVVDVPLVCTDNGGRWTAGIGFRFTVSRVPGHTRRDVPKASGNGSSSDSYRWTV